MTLPDSAYAACMAHFHTWTFERYAKLIAHFETMQEVWEAGVHTLVQAGIEEEISEEFLLRRMEIDPEEEWKKITKEKIKVITIQDAQYPRLLKEIYHPPVILFVRGTLPQEISLPIAVVGSRKHSSYGKQICQEIVRTLVDLGSTVVSGLALGIDGIAHGTTLEYKGTTIAILGSGIDQRHIYPPPHQMLSERIVDSGGALISEYPPGTLPLHYHFPERNRIIAGMTIATIVIEAGKTSGALITARYALEENRDVGAVPGNIHSPYSIGPNTLIKMGAKVITDPEDIVHMLNLTDIKIPAQNKKITGDSPEEKIILSYITREPMHIDELIRCTELKSETVMSILTLMEMQGKIKNLGGMSYILAR